MGRCGLTIRPQIDWKGLGLSIGNGEKGKRRLATWDPTVSAKASPKLTLRGAWKIRAKQKFRKEKRNGKLHGVVGGKLNSKDDRLKGKNAASDERANKSRGNISVTTRYRGTQKKADPT